MPHAEMKSARRAKRELQQRTPLGGRRISSALTARSSSNTPNIPESESQSISAPIPKAPIPIITQTAPPTPQKGWRNPADLPFISKAGKTWDDPAIIRFLRTKAAFSIPPRAASTADPWVIVRCIGADTDGELVRLPRGYRIPLLWVAKFLWSSVALILAPADPAVRKDEWDDAKLDILHAARLCDHLLSAAAEAGAGMDRGWRCAAFDRALRRYWHRWLVSRDEFVRDFWREFGEEEYEGDVLKLGWGQWVLKGHKGFAVTKQEVLNGITMEEFIKGLVVDEDEGTFQWLPSTTESPTTEHHSHGTSTVPVQTPEWRTVHVQALPTPLPSAASGNFVYDAKIESRDENALQNFNLLANVNGVRNTTGQIVRSLPPLLPPSLLFLVSDCCC
ncbi:hypothetical protein B0H16DRAFT_1499687 [Mycena metata]|uniref:Uncharacterized protein n=1 Tax=Mycena metata TaxID=1033252 RepID=A0AAD7NXE2_9AGAR|nr:hypothetical protein B0H16DRAFT_1499687 [Mycena metata]